MTNDSSPTTETVLQSQTSTEKTSKPKGAAKPKGSTKPKGTAKSKGQTKPKGSAKPKGAEASPRKAASSKSSGKDNMTSLKKFLPKHFGVSAATIKHLDSIGNTAAHVIKYMCLANPRALTYEEIVTRVKAERQNCNTSVACGTWYAANLRNESHKTAKYDPKGEIGKFLRGLHRPKPQRG